MEGHKRNMRGSPICPSLPNGSDGFDSNRYASEPPPLAQSSPLAKPQIARGPSPWRATTPTPPHPQSVKTNDASTPRSALVIPETGPWHWRNPNFVEKPPMPPPPPRPSSPSGSFVPTVLVDSEGRTIRARSKSNSDFNSSGGMRSVGTTSSMLMDRLALMSKPVVSIFNTKYEDIPRIQSTADRLGFHTGVVHRTLDTDARLLDTVEKEEDENDVKVDVAYARAQRRKKLRPQREASWWLVLGQNKATVQQVIDSQQRGLPGAIASTGEMMEGPRMVTLPYALAIGIIGGLVAACGLYYSLVSIL
ncbi:hypothetical protein APHAL10511_001577 [Amanita phalloides]|nr:hypothetical protein APHAL10511_001577 [Amanita phalloides]